MGPGHDGSKARELLKKQIGEGQRSPVPGRRWAIHAGVATEWTARSADGRRGLLSGFVTGDRRDSIRI